MGLFLPLFIVHGPIQENGSGNKFYMNGKEIIPDEVIAESGGKEDEYSFYVDDEGLFYKVLNFSQETRNWAPSAPSIRIYRLNLTSESREISRVIGERPCKTHTSN